MVDLGRIDLNLLVYLDVLLRERNVSRAAVHLGLSQPALSNGLRRLRDLFNDPILVRTSEGMTPTKRAQELQPVVRDVLSKIDMAVQPQSAFDETREEYFFRIMASDYAEATLFPHVLSRLREQAPGIVLDVMTPSDVSFLDVEQGKVDMVLNRFDDIPLSFHQKKVWKDGFACLMSANNPLQDNFTLDTYLDAPHIWVSKTGMGVGVGMNPHDVQHLGWVDEALRIINKQRRITVFTRHYQAAMLLAENTDLIVTLPSRAAELQRSNPRVVIKEPPFRIPPFDLKIAWSPLLQHTPAHRWMRRFIVDVAHSL
ncbi:MAG: LysR family transcriptional regulator [Proteobacteria bacterium]|nr:MAG: LysR family transcriptional regulator [Pseudomonadota bacterium]